jgi:hypothetical protein
MRFRVDAGSHVEGGKAFYKGGPNGDVVETDKQLDQMFANKFTRLSDVAPKFKGGKKTKEAAREPDEDEPPPGEVNPEGDPSYDNAKMTGVEATTSKLGENVTDEFDDAKEAGLCVFSNGQNYFVADPDDPNSALNEKTLKKFNVTPFVRKYAGMTGEEAKEETSKSKAAAKKSKSTTKKVKSKKAKEEAEDE